MKATKIPGMLCCAVEQLIQAGLAITPCKEFRAHKDHQNFIHQGSPLQLRISNKQNLRSQARKVEFGGFNHPIDSWYGSAPTILPWRCTVALHVHQHAYPFLHLRTLP